MLLKNEKISYKWKYRKKKRQDNYYTYYNLRVDIRFFYRFIRIGTRIMTRPC